VIALVAGRTRPSRTSGPGAARRATVLHTAAGRLRVGWRLLLFTVLLAVLFLSLSWPLGPDFTLRSAALLVSALAAGWALLALDGRGPAALGMPLRREALPHLGLGLALGTLVAAVAVGGMALAGAVRWTAEPGTLGSWLGTGAAALAVLALPAAAEEVVLRGYPLQAAAETWGPGVALVGTAAVFSLLHGSNPGIGPAGLANIFVAGLFLGAVYLRSGSLWWATGAHLGWNWALGFGADLPVSGIDVADVPLLDAHTAGHELVSGGLFGPEGSLLSTGVVALAAAWVWTTPRLRPAGWVRDSPPLARLRVVPARAGTEAKGAGE